MSSLDYFADVKLNFIGQIALAVIVFGIVMFIFDYIFGYTKRFIKSYKGTVDIYPGLKNAERLYHVSNNPMEKKTYVNIPRSYNEENGVEFTYQFWMLIENWNIRPGKLKHVFHRGNKLCSAVGCDVSNDIEIPLLNSPGVYLDRTENQLLVVMNTFANPGRNGGAAGDSTVFSDEDTLIKVPNIPINKWTMITIVLEGQLLKVYKNGYLQTTKVLTSYPRQNNAPIWVNDMNGFSGFISKLKYYNYAVKQSEIESYVNDGPGSSACLKNKDVPRYMSNTYIEDKYTTTA